MHNQPAVHHHASSAGSGGAGAAAPEEPGRFCAWYPLDQAAARAPAAPGVFQVRVRRGLLSYPRGKSAMVRYGHGDDLSRELAGLAARHAGMDWLCRHIVAADREDALALFEELLGRFTTRFGTPPAAPELRGGLGRDR